MQCVAINLIDLILILDCQMATEQKSYDLTTVFFKISCNSKINIVKYLY